jgi:hypothetical protein
MRRMIAVLAAALSVWGCGGSSTSSGDGGGGGGGACPAFAGAYSTHWMYVSGGAMCMQRIPPDSTTDGGASASASASVDAGSSCPLVQNGCSYSLSCNTPIGDAGSSQVTEMFTIASDGSVSGTLSYSFSFTFGGQTTMQACAYSFTATKQ